MNDMALLPSADIGVTIRSALPGRFRIWVPGLYRNEELKRTLERGLNGSASRRTVSANVVAATVLVITPPDAAPGALVDEIAALVRDHADESRVSVAELEQRGRVKPVHLMVNGSSGGSLFSFSLSFKKGAARPDPGLQQGPGEEQAVHPWHTLDERQIVELLRLDARDGASAMGLSDEEARARLARFSTNELTQLAKRSALAMFLDQFKELPVLLLAGSTVLSMATGGVADGLVILGVIVLNGVIGFVTENTAERTIASLTHEDAPDVEVIRQGEWLRVPLQEIVPGDVLRLYPGSLVPADARLLRAQDLSVDESALTGESVPVSKSVKVIGDPDLPLADRTNMVYRGTFVTGGSGLALVVATGRATQVGQLQTMVGEVGQPDTPSAPWWWPARSAEGCFCSACCAGRRWAPCCARPFRWP